ncbi:MAG TPA: c-type cytochrome [Usitatibacter sp.]|nr:c-type cytochrome [Usitatibacter sp.]
MKTLALAIGLSIPFLALANDPAKVERGKYVVTVSGCNDCHTPWKMGDKGPEPDYTRMLSGHPEEFVLPPAPKQQGPWIVSAAATNTAWAGPWGVSFTANLTPDAETGLGKWTLRNFKETIRTGRHLGRGRPILPPMPIPMYKHFTDADLEAIYAYLQSIPPVKNKVPDPLPPATTVAETKR